MPSIPFWRRWSGHAEMERTREEGGEERAAGGEEREKGDRTKKGGRSGGDQEGVGVDLAGVGAGRATQADNAPDTATWLRGAAAMQNR